MYADAFLDHFRNPRFQGRLPDATHHGRGVDPACGDELDLDLNIVEGTIESVRFRARGCPGAIAVGSVLASLLPGRPARVDALGKAEIEAALGAVPATKRHALRLAESVLKDALGG